MLQQMRKLSKSWISSIFLGGLALSFGVWGIADIFRGNTDTSVATVGSQKISFEDFQRDYRNFLRGASQQVGHEVSMDEARAHGLDKQALQAILNRSAIDQVVAKYGLRATDAEVSSTIRAMPSFRGPLGTFDHQQFLYRLQNAGYTEDGFVQIERQELSRDQLLDAVHNGVQVAPGYARILFDYVNERRAADYIVVPKTAAGVPPPPSDAQLAEYIKAHAQAFSTPEYRDITYAVAGPQDVMNKISVTDEQLQQQYELRKDQYQIPEKRDVEQIVFPDQASATAARAKIDSGTSFTNIAAQRGLKPSDISLGTVVQADLGKDRGPPTFALPANGVTQPIKSSFGWVLVHVTKIAPGSNKTFAEVKDALRKDVTTQLAQAKLTDVTNAFDDASAGGASLADAAKRAGMRVVHIAAVDAAGLTPSGAKAGLPTSADFVAQLKKSEVGEESDPFPSSDGNVYVIKVNGTTPPKLKPLSEVRSQAVAAWTDAWETQRLASMAAQLVAAAKSAISLAPVAARFHVSVQSTGAMDRRSQPVGLTPQFVSKLFDAPPGGVISVRTANRDGVIVARVTGIAHPPATMGDFIYQRFASSIGGEEANDLETTLAIAARQRLGVSVNQQQVGRVTGGS
ncbi:MAG TPA: SurA N-terminal domain-containing protein [Rhizomicrobium sp.]|jgi:peptidyl-prolyl cis-trans isomerase D|nr:SurA N-terminal domain-containing protein [Rhizomicrobium sp.]